MAKLRGTPKVYSGERSKRFWDRIRRLPEPEQAIVYLGGCALQDVEERVWQMIDEAEQRAMALPRPYTAGNAFQVYPP